MTAPSVPATPPLPPLLDVVARLEALGIPCALGGSGLLAALGLADRVGDWDLTTDATVEEMLPAARGLAWERAGSDALHADAKLMFPELDIEVIARFAFHVPGGVVRIPTVVTGRWRGVPLGSPEGWAVAYDLLGRAGKRDRLLAHLRAHGHDAAVVRVLRAQPLPPGIAAALAAL